MYIHIYKYMSDKQLFGQPKFVVPHVRGNNVINQEQVLRKLKTTQPSKQQLQTKLNQRDSFTDLVTANREGLIQPINSHTQDEKEEKYDPYIGYLHENGLLGTNNNSRYNIHNITIDSKNRNKKSYINAENAISLSNNPLLFTRNSDEIKIKHVGHSYSLNDRITLTGVPPKVIQLTSTGIVKVDKETDLGGGVGECTYDVTTGSIFEFTTNSKYMKINHTHYLPVQCNYTEVSGNVIFINDSFYDTFDASNLVVQISGFMGNRLDLSNTPYYDNIPVNYINNKHKIILKDPTTDRIKRNIFFIELPRKYIPFGTEFEESPVKYSFTITYYYIAGIPVNVINAEYPIDIDHLKGFHTISDVETDYYSIKTNYVSTGIAHNDTGDLITDEYTGGTRIISSQAINILKGYPYSNSYSVEIR